MSSKFRKQQRQKRYTEAGCEKTPEFVSLITQLATQGGDSLKDFGKTLLDFTECVSTFQELECLKQIISNLLKLAPSDENQMSPEFKSAVTAYWAILFLHNSKPLHRQVLSVLSGVRSGAARSQAEDLLVDALQARLTTSTPLTPPALSAQPHTGGAEHDVGAPPSITSSSSDGEEEAALRLATPLQSIICFKPTAALIRRCLGPLVVTLGGGVLKLLSSQLDNRLSPQCMDQIQEVLSSLYFILQRCAEEVQGMAAGASTGTAAVLGAGLVEGLGLVVRALLRVLSTPLLSREAQVAAGVALVAALNVGPSARAQGLHLAVALYSAPPSPAQDATSTAESDARKRLEISRTEFAYEREEDSADDVTSVIDSQVFKPLGTSLEVEMQKLTPFGRLCVLRGALTSAPRSALLTRLIMRKSGGQAGGEPESRGWTVLMDGALPELCHTVEVASDAHVRFHAAAALHFGLLQVKAASSAASASAAQPRPAQGGGEVVMGGEADGLGRTEGEEGEKTVERPEMSEALLKRLLGVCWANLEDPLAQTVRQVQSLFQELVSIQTLGGSEGRVLLQSVAVDLLSMQGRRKGKYLPLALLVPHLGAREILRMKEDLLEDMFESMRDEVVCCSAAQLLDALLRNLLGAQQPSSSSSSSPPGSGVSDEEWLGIWVPPMLSALCGSDERRRLHVATHALPVPLKIRPSATLTAFLTKLTAQDQTHQEEEGLKDTDAPGRAAAVVAILKVARGLGVVKALEESVVVDGVRFPLPRADLEGAVLHGRDAVRLDALELCCCCPQKAAIPGALEIHLLKLALPACMRMTHTGSRNKVRQLVRKFLTRLHVGSERVVHVRELRARHQATGGQVKGLLAESLQRSETLEGGVTEDEAALCCASSFLRWLMRFLFSCLYPGAPFERRHLALDLLLAVADEWGLGGSQARQPGGCVKGVRAADTKQHSGPAAVTPFGSWELSEAPVGVLVGAVVDSWDKVREAASKLLLLYPSPLPGLDTPETLRASLQWTRHMLASPRVRESDAGALLLRLWVRKYTLTGPLWRLQLHPEVTVSVREEEEEEGVSADPLHHLFQFIHNLADLLQAEYENALQDFVGAAVNGLCHGPLLAIRYSLGEVGGVREMRKGDQALGPLKQLLTRVLTLTLQVGRLTMGWMSGEKLRRIALNTTDVVKLTGVGVTSEDADMEAGEDGGGEFDDEEMHLGLQGQKVMTAGWMTMKEVALVIGDLVNCVPCTPSSSSSSSSQGPTSPNSSQGDATVPRESGHVLPPELLKQAGEYFFESLIVMKHNGAVEKTRLGLTLLSEHLLQSPLTSLSQLPGQWLEALLVKVAPPPAQQPGGYSFTVNDMHRRSAGIPYAFLSLFMAEPANCPKSLFPRGMEALLSIGAGEAPGQRGNLDLSNTAASISRVHAFNVLRMVFNDTDLSVDTQPHSARGLQVSIQAFGSPAWEVRNAAALAFGSLITRMVGSANHSKNAIANRRTTTGADFFHRYPSLHPFLLELLSSAAAADNHEAPGVSHLHPGLHPVLMLLARLRPSVQCSNLEDPLSPRAFVPGVMHTASSSPHFAIRALAARALAPLIAPEDLLETCLGLLAPLATPQPYNAVHAALLQVGTLLREHVSSLASSSPELSALLGSLSRMLVLRLPLLKAPAPIRAQLLSVCHALFCLNDANISKESDSDGAMDEHHRHLAELKSRLLPECVALLSAPVSQISAGDSSCRKLAARVACQLSMEGRLGALSDVTGQVARLMNDDAYEARKAAAKVLTQNPQQLFSGVLDHQQLLAVILQRLPKETDHKCMFTLLQLFFMLTCPHQSIPEVHPRLTGKVQVGSEWWDPLIHLLKHSRNLRVQEESLRCLGVVLRSLVQGGLESGEGTVMRVQAWLEAVEGNSCPKCPPSSREAAANSLQASEVLCLREGAGDEAGKSQAWTSLTLRAWAVTLKLMEDDDSEARSAAAKAASRALPGTTTHAHEHEVIRMCFAHLTTTFGSRSDEYQRLLVSSILGEVSGGGAREAEVEVEAEEAEEADVLFEKEEDNLYGEPLFIAQVAAVQLRSIAQDLQRTSDQSAVVESWRREVLGYLNSLIENLRATSSVSGSSEGPCHQKGTFLRTSSVLLALHSLAPLDCQELDANTSSAEQNNTQSTIQQIVCAANSLAAIPHHPQVIKMITVLISSYTPKSNEMSDESLASDDEDNVAFLVA